MIKKWVGEALVKGGVKPITELLKAVKELFTDSKGKWSSKRTVSGVIVIAASLHIEKNGIDTNALILTALGVLPLCFSVFEKNNCNISCCKEK
ncbi:MAG: hypothetical protein CMD14_02390 [Flavobacteriales bacterium]|jgi:hypothetical protein|nr:hypothetical protein [Flavobacteriales bacterium]|tara:strand:+ start:646 stop:924 length:279 start_codon:yes stop_codon:yes gene_type:complete